MVKKLRLPGMNRQVLLYLLYSGLFYVGLFGITGAILNFYFVSLGHDPEIIGILQALPRLAGLLIGIPAGIMANRIGARRLTIYATIAVALTYPMLVLFPSLFMLATSRFLLGLFFGAVQIVSAPLMMTLTANQFQTHQFSYHSLVTMTATAIGSTVAGYIPLLAVGITATEAQSPQAYGTALVVSGGIIALSALPLVWLQSETIIRKGKTPWDFGSRNIPWRQLIWLTLPFLFFGFSGGLTFPFYDLFFRTTYGLSDEAVGVILGLGWLFMGIVTLSNPWWDRRFGRARGLGITMTIAAIAFLLLSVASSLWLGVIAYLVAISVRNTMSPLFQPLLMDSLSPVLHNMASSVGFVLWNFGYFTASILGGIWQSNQGFGFIMQVVAISVFATGLGVVLVFRKPQIQIPPPIPKT